MLLFIDNFLNKITMYRLVLYVLTGMWIGAFILSILNILPHNPVLFLVSSLFILLICFVSNQTFATLFKVPANVESVYISSFILILIVDPVKNLGDFSYWEFLLLASFLAMASKYILAINKKHIFNPVAFAVVTTSLLINYSASWWVGTFAMMPFVLIGGLLIVRKIRKFDLVITFLATALILVIGLRSASLTEAVVDMVKILPSSLYLFFAFIMLTEPLTTPPTRIGRILYGLVVGFFFLPSLHVGPMYPTPELALLLGNIFAYIISPKQKLVLKLKEKIKIANDTYDFVFYSDKKLKFKSGQYLEWTIDPSGADSRGNRRYFTLASSPTEDEIRMGVKFYENGSTFKKKLLAMNAGDSMTATQLSGEFILPKEKEKKLAFLAGGIGITPFRSMLKNLLDTGEKRDMIMLYSNRTPNEIAYREIISEAEDKAGLKNIHTVTDELPVDTVWNGRKGMVNKEMLLKEIPDYAERYFYISGTHGMVVAFEKMLKELGVPKSKIKKDFFPGYA